MSKLLSKKKESSSSRISSSQGHSPTKEVPSLVASAGPGDLRRSCFPIWPEWNETEVNAEKWDAPKGVKDGKAGKSPFNFFDDPEGRVELPASFKVHTWKRPLEHAVNKTPVVFEHESSFDLISANEHLLSSELMRWIISEIYVVWKVCNGAEGKDETVSMDAACNPWRPWEHIYSLCKAAKDHIPLYNVYGKYVVRLYWMGCWRKIMIDDSLPFDEKDNLLLPATTNQSELWPMLLAKAILKLANTDVAPDSWRQLGDFTVVHSLTGWTPELIPLESRYVGKVWEFLRGAIPEFQALEEGSEERTASSKETEASKASECQMDSLTVSKEMHKGTVPPPGPQMVVCACYHPLHLQEKKTSALSQMADSSERLRQYGLSHLYSHPVLLTRSRACPLVAVPKTPPVKLESPQKEANLTDEPKEPPVQKPEQYIEVTSPFIDSRPVTLELDLRPNHHNISQNKLDSDNDMDTTTEPQVAAEDKKDENVTDESLPDPAKVETERESDTEEKGGQAETGSLVLQSEKMLMQERTMLQQTWVHMEDFPICFQNLLVFHKPNTYTHHFQKSQFKSFMAFKASASAVTNMAASTTSVTSGKVPGSSLGTPEQGQDEKGYHYLFVDSLLPTEIVICFSALVHWGETMDENKEPASKSGVLMAEPFSWKSISAQFPQLHIQTTACKAALLSLPLGRHVFRIHTRAPLGFHLQLFSMTSFVFGEEEEVMSHLDKESLRFCEQDLVILRALGGVIRSFSEPQELPLATIALEEALCPPSHSKVANKEHWKVFNEALYHMFCSVLGRKLTSEELFAVQTLTGDPTPHWSNKRGTDTQSTDGAPEGWSGRQATEQEKQAATILQAGWKGYLVREILNAARPGTEENQKVAKTLQEMWARVEPDAAKHAVSLLSYMFTADERIVDSYPCGKDEWTRITFAEYSVPVPEIAGSWVLLFREVFHIPKDMLLVAKMYSPLPACLLHVINNDTGEEIPRVFNRVEPYVYTKNKAGYTFVAEAYTGDTPLVGGKWRMHLVGSREPLPQLAREVPSSNFSVKEFKDYYLPNEKNIICRYAVKVTSDHIATVQFQTSKSDVHIKLSILDHEKEVACKEGKGHAIIPIYCFSANKGSSGNAQDSEGVRQSQDSPASQRGGGGGGEEKAEVGGKECPSTASRHPLAELDHKFIVQAEVLYKSWPLDESLSGFIQTLREIERNVIRVSSDKTEDVAMLPNVDQSSSTDLKSSVSRNSRKTKEKEKDRSKSGFQSLDISKPHWTLHVVSERAEGMEVRKDTERVEQIRAIKQAWEAAEPGRADKARQSRLQFINKHLRPLSGHKAEDAETVTAETGVQSHSSHSSTKENGVMIDMDYTLYIRRTGKPARLKDTVVEEEQMRIRSERIQAFRLLRDTVLEQRKRELISRRELKRRQLETYGAMQAALAEQRQKMLQAREVFRSRLLEEESLKRGEEPTLEAGQEVEVEKNQPQPTARKSGAKRK